MYIVEHGIYLAQVVYSYTVKVEKCHAVIEDHWRHFFMAEYRHVFDIIPFSTPLAILIFVSFIYLILIKTGLTKLF